MATVRKVVGAMLLVGALGGCAAQTIVLLPGEAGHPVGGVRILAQDGSARVVLDQAGQGVSGNSDVPRQIALKPQYAQLAGGLPPVPTSFVLSFVPGALEPEETEANRRAIEYIRDEIAVRPGVEVQVTGHTTTIGDGALNFEVSLKRAEKFREYLISSGVPADMVSAVGRGGLAPLDRYPENDRRNSRIEVIVR